MMRKIVFYDLGWVDRDSKELDRMMRVSDRAVIIIASREQDLLKQLKGSNKAMEELPAPFLLTDHTDDEMLQLLRHMLRARDLGPRNEDANRHLRILVRRAARERGVKPNDVDGFRNLHDLEDELDTVCRRRGLRLQSEYRAWLHGKVVKDGHHQLTSCSQGEQQQPCDDAIEDESTLEYASGSGTLTSEDILGPEPANIKDDNESWKKLEKMIGLEKIKSEFDDIIGHAQMNRRRESMGLEPHRISLSRLFLGPPGVGKTTVAQLYGQILIDLGLLSGDTVTIKNPSDLIGQYIGDSEANTKEALGKAQGNVLIIDDAHMLYPGDHENGNTTDVFRIGIIDTIVARVSAEPEDRCVILVGYDHQMENMLNNSNPGLQRRFPKESALRFEHYGDDELCQILDLNVEKKGLSMTADAKEVARQVLSRMRINPKFGNAGDVGNLLSQAMIRRNTRTKGMAMDDSEFLKPVLEPRDIDPKWDRLLRAGENRSDMFKDFVGFKRIVQRFERYQLQVAGCRLHGLDPRPHIPWNFVFKGPPGTGKTSTARNIGRLYYDMGLLSTEEVVICSVTDLVGTHVGHTGPKVKRALESGLGKVLFIDEAYRLADGDASFHMDAVNELVDAMTQPRYRNNMVVILAGYDAEMELLMRINPGLRSRFPEDITFPSLDPRMCMQHLKKEIRKMGIKIVNPGELGEEYLAKVHKIFEELSLTPGWASGRDVQTLAKAIIGNVFMREGKREKKDRPGSLWTSMYEIVIAQEDMLGERTARHIEEA